MNVARPGLEPRVSRLQCEHSTTELPNHYENKSMQHTEIFLALKIENFQLKNVHIFLIFAQNTDCGYTLDPPW